ncbi:MAG TPA: hypothetical protein PKG48_11130 [Bacteroidales bacterium]|nr:hypothetical protein [Bacteroidales bacterium]HPS63605.1 hypothetical protein [Bacteroidales bacterium]
MNGKITIAVILLFALVSCRSEHKVIEETWPDGTPKRVCIYHGRGKDKELIRETTYYANKQIQMDGTYKDDKREGQWTYWYENGNKWSEGVFVKGKSEGRRVTYFENGKVRYEGYYKDDNRVGKWRFFDETGRLLQEVDYSAPATPQSYLK